MNDLKVIHSNKMNQIPLKNFTGIDLNLFYTLCAKTKDKGTDIVEITFAEIKELTGYTQTSIEVFIRDLDRMNEKLIHCSGRIETASEITRFVLFSTFTIDKDNQVLRVRVNQDFTWMLNNLASEFTMFELKQYVSMEGVYSKALFRVLKQWRQQGCTQKYSVEEIKELLNTPDYKPPILLRDVINPAISEIKKKKVWCNLWCEVIHKRARGNPVEGYRFHFNDNSIEGQMSVEDYPEFLPKKKAKAPDQEVVDSEISAKMKKIVSELEEKDIQKLCNIAEFNDITPQELLEIMEYVAEKDTKNYVGYVMKLLKDGWDKPKVTKKKNSFNNFQQRDYDFDALEKMLLNR